MNKELHRHDISDSAWEKIKPHTIGEKGTRGGNAKNTRQFTNGALLKLDMRKRMSVDKQQKRVLNHL